MLVVLWRLRYKLSLRDLAEIFLVLGFELTYNNPVDNDNQHRLLACGKGTHPCPFPAPISRSSRTKTRARLSLPAPFRPSYSPSTPGANLACPSPTYRPS